MRKFPLCFLCLGGIRHSILFQSCFLVCVSELNHTLLPPYSLFTSFYLYHFGLCSTLCFVNIISMFFSISRPFLPPSSPPPPSCRFTSTAFSLISLLFFFPFFFLHVCPSLSLSKHLVIPSLLTSCCLFTLCLILGGPHTHTHTHTHTVYSEHIDVAAGWFVACYGVKQRRLSSPTLSQAFTSPSSNETHSCRRTHIQQAGALIEQYDHTHTQLVQTNHIFPLLWFW